MDNQTTYYKYDEIKNELLDYVEDNNLTLSKALQDDALGTIEKITNAERLVNLYAYWLGYEVIAELQAEQEEE
jgi:hypothetical protein